MSYLNQLQQTGDSQVVKRKKEYIKYNYGSIIDKLLAEKNCCVLEIGPGLGDFVSYCNDSGVRAVDVIDMDREVLANLKKRFAVRKAILTNNPLKRRSILDKYNLIIATQVLEHLPKKTHIGFLKLMYRHLCRGGYIILTVPNIGNPLGIFERYYDYTHETAFTERSLLQLVDYAHLKGSRVFLQSFRIPPVSLLNIIRSGVQQVLHGVFRMLYMANGGVYPSILTTNITLVIGKAA